MALLRLVAELARARIDLLDVQWLTPHLASLGVVELSRRDYLARLGVASRGAPQHLVERRALELPAGWLAAHV